MNGMTRGIVALAAAAVLVLLAVGSGGSPAAHAFGDTGPVPVKGLWCGMTEDGGSVRLTVTDDQRFVYEIEIRTPAGAIVATEGFGRSEAQIKSGKFVYRASERTETEDEPGPPARPSPGTPGGPGRCIQAPCRPVAGPPPPPGSSRGGTTATRTVTVRGEFDTADSLGGSYNGITTITGGNRRPTTERLIGRYTAWPSSLVSCP